MATKSKYRRVKNDNEAEKPANEIRISVRGNPYGFIVDAAE